MSHRCVAVLVSQPVVSLAARLGSSLMWQAFFVFVCLFVSAGIQTGSCVKFDVMKKTCEVSAWCPVETRTTPPRSVGIDYANVPFLNLNEFSGLKKKSFTSLLFCFVGQCSPKAVTCGETIFYILRNMKKVKQFCTVCIFQIGFTVILLSGLNRKWVLIPVESKFNAGLQDLLITNLFTRVRILLSMIFLFV